MTLLSLAVAVIIYHFGCWVEYKLKIEDTAHVVPVHGAWYVINGCGFCGYGSMIFTAIMIMAHLQVILLYCILNAATWQYVRYSQSEVSKIKKKRLGITKKLEALAHKFKVELPRASPASILPSLR